MSHFVMNRIEVAAEAAEHFEKGFAQSMRATLQAVPGLVRAELLRPAQEGLPYVAVMEFTTSDAFRAWMASDSFRAAHSGASAGSAGDAPTGSAIEQFETVARVDG